MTWTLRKWRAILVVNLQDGFAYRASGVIWVLTDLVRSVMMPFVFIAATQVTGEVAGMTAVDFVAYYVVMLLFLNFITSHLMWDLAQEIKEGIFSIQLVRPINYLQYTFIRNFSWRVLRLLYFSPFLIGLVILFHTYLKSATLNFGIEVWIAVIMGHLVSFSLVYSLSMLALIFQESRSLFEFYYFPMLFLSGQIVPIHLLPEWAIQAGKWLPFYYTTALPTELSIGRIAPSDAWPLIGFQAAWVAIHLGLAHILWRIGLKHYTAVGM